MDKIPGYGKVQALRKGRFLDGLLDGGVSVQEKIDGSQFSFGVTDGELLCRSRGRQIVIEEVDSLFAKAVDTALG